MSEKDLLLAIDNGTQSLKALIFDLQGQLLAKELVPFAPYFSEHPAWAEQDPDLFWDALCRACQGLWHQHPEYKERIAGVALTTQRGTVVNVDKSGKPLRPAMVWLDQRKTHGLEPMAGWWGVFFGLAGLKKTVAYLQSEAEANWIATYQPEIWQNTHKYLLLSGYLTYRLVGQFVDSVGCQVGYIPFDYKRQRWSAGWDWKWRLLPFNVSMMPELVPPGEILGTITTQAAKESGIPEGLPLVAAAADKACEVIGSGSLESNIGCLSYGTTATINVTHQKYIEPIPLIPPEQAANSDLNPEQLFDKLVDDIEPGAMGLMLQPYWTPGLKMPGPEAKGAIIGFGDVHTRAHLYRSILEGLAYALREGKERIEKRSRTSINSLRVSGGGSQSRNAMQLTADIFGLPTAKPHLYETSGLGAAIDAAVGLGLHPDFKTAVREMTHIGEVYEPNRRNQTKRCTSV